MPDANKAGAASPRVPAGDEMMPTLPEPLELRLKLFARAKKQEGWFRGADATDVTGGWEPEAVHWNHAAYEAERALRVAILEALRDEALRREVVEMFRFVVKGA